MKSRNPFDGVYCRAGRCEDPRKGIGVFAVRDIPKGIDVFKTDSKGTGHWWTLAVLPGSEWAKSLAQDFGVFEEKKQRFYGPSNFNSLTVGWYVNHSKKPNIAYSETMDSFISLRSIRAGEEVCSDYTAYSDLSEYGDKVPEWLA